MFWPPKMSSHSFIQNCCWITLQVSHHQGWALCQNRKVRLIFRSAYRLSGTGIVECLAVIDVGCNLKQFGVGGLTWLTLTPIFYDRSTPLSIHPVTAYRRDSIAAAVFDKFQHMAAPRVSWRRCCCSLFGGIASIGGLQFMQVTGLAMAEGDGGEEECVWFCHCNTVRKISKISASNLSGESALPPTRGCDCSAK